MDKNSLPFERLRKEMVEKLEAEGIIRDSRIKEAVLTVPRHLFVPDRYEDIAYEDMPIYIGEGQTISAPHMVALMSEALDIKAEHRVLEVGSGSGYHACVTGFVANKGEVYSVERLASLAEIARKNIERAGLCRNVKIIVGDGSKGYAEAAPYDRICVTAGAPTVPQVLKEQMKIGGKLLIPVGSRNVQELLRITKTGKDRYIEENLGGCVFVPLIGENAWH